MPASIFEAYVCGGASELFPSSFAHRPDRERAVVAARSHTSPQVLASLQVGNARFGQSAARAANLSALADGAAAVVTGQQVGLFLGPLYTVYKAASAVRVARALSELSGRAVVPIFWLQTEDHDLAEIARCTLPRGAEAPVVLEVPSGSDNHVSIAHLRLPEAIAGCLATLEAELAHLPAARTHLDRLARHYRPGTAWSDAFAGLLAELFEPEGLLLIDPRDRALAAEVREVHQRALAESEALAAVLLERSAALERAGFQPTVHVRPGCPLSFYHPGAADGPRYRLAPDAGDWIEIGGGARRHTRAQLDEALAADPLRFSSSALLRPIVQDSLLPTAAYVAGPAEVAYYAQLAPLYASFGLPVPLIVPRARLCVIEPAARRRLTRLGLTPSALERGEQRLLEELATRAGDGPSPARFQHELREGFERVLSSALGELRVPLAPLQLATTRARSRLTSTAEKLAARYASVLAKADALRVTDVRRLEAMLYPGGVPQERVFGISYFASRYGERPFLESVLGAIDPFDPARKELYL